MLNYLALGDSYTVGEGVPLQQSFPYQMVQLLRKWDVQMSAPELIAQTGWTSGELIRNMNSLRFLHSYSIVTVLTGVNNQYRGLPIKEYEKELKVIVKKAIALAGKQPEGVFILSIPDWGLTPFAEGRDRNEIAMEINQYNHINLSIAQTSGAHYLDITRYPRENINDESLITNDKLHPSAKEYHRWAKLLATSILKQVH